MEATTKRPQASAIWVALAWLAATLGGGCGGDPRGTARQREWDSLVQTKRALDAERREVAGLRGKLAGAAVRADGAPADAWAQQLAAELARREGRLLARSAALEDRLVRHVKSFGSPVSPDASPDLLAAIHLKSDEDIAVAEDWIERGGDYRRAIEILETQRHVDPAYPPLARALERARTMRYVTAERFARVRAGMTPVEVRAFLGPVNLRQVLRRPAEQLEAWFYPKAGGGQAGIYFRFDAQRRAFVVYASELSTEGRRPVTATGTS